MGWWWRSSPQKDDAKPSQSTLSELGEQKAPPPKKLTPDEQADLEFRQLLASLREEDTALSKKTGQPPSITDANLTPGGNDAPPTTHTETPSSSIAPESLYDDTMSCRTAFDYAFFCQSFGGQFVNVYRYGELRSCSEHWDNFWLCMRTRTWPDDLRRQAIRNHNRKKAVKYKTGPSSEDVWDVRLEPARDDFQGDFAALEREMQAEEEKL